MHSRKEIYLCVVYVLFLEMEVLSIVGLRDLIFGKDGLPFSVRIGHTSDAEWRRRRIERFCAPNQNGWIGTRTLKRGDTNYDTELHKG